MRRAGGPAGRGYVMTEESVTEQRVATATSIGAATLVLTVGLLQFAQGIAGVAESEGFSVGYEYTYRFDLIVWGWFHIAFGVLLCVVGLALAAGARWARVAAIVFAAISILANFLWLPYYPSWSMVIIALDVAAIWAVSTWKPPPF